MINKIIEKSKNIYSYIALSMTVLFAILPLFMIIGPKYYGKAFNAFAQVEISVLAACAVWYVVVFSIKAFSRSFKSAWAELCISFREYFLRRRHAGLLLAVYVITVISALMAPDRSRAFWGTDFRPDGLFMHTAFLELIFFHLH